MFARKILFIISAAILALFLFPAYVSAGEDDDAGGNAVDSNIITKQQVDAAVKKAVEFLKGQQKDDGSWVGTKDYESYYPYGTTALVAYALVKGGESKKSPCIQKAIAYLRGPQDKWMRDFEGVYAASCLILFLTAVIEEDALGKDNDNDDPTGGMRTVPIDDDREKKIRQGMANEDPWLRTWLQQAVNYLVKVKEPKSVWRYPGTNPGEKSVQQNGVGGPLDASNTQYVMMAFFAARRVGIDVPKNTYLDVAEYFIKNQEEKGEEGPGMPVPGADMSIEKLRDLEKKWTKELNKMLKEEKERAKKAGEEFKGVDLGTVSLDQPPEFGGEGSPRARGWSYLPLDAPKTDTNRAGNQVTVPEGFLRSTGSMTCSGIIACMLCKAELESTQWYKENGKKLRKAIHDGWTWIAKNWTTQKNPNVSKEDSWRYYYFYSIERAGVLSLVSHVDTHDWYNEIGKIILSEQTGDGSWAGATASMDPGFKGFDHGPTWNTCFAILFLKKSTTPIVNPVIFTGSYLGGGKGEKEKENEGGKK
jgi:hypothetical protein